MAMDFLLRSHALGMVYPAPLEAAMWCFKMFGNLALCATHPHHSAYKGGAASGDLVERSAVHKKTKPHHR